MLYNNYKRLNQLIDLAFFYSNSLNKTPAK
jgi:hypothetical protein